MTVAEARAQEYRRAVGQAVMKRRAYACRFSLVALALVSMMIGGGCVALCRFGASTPQELDACARLEQAECPASRFVAVDGGAEGDAAR